MPIKVLTIFGTRPEAIKIAPVVRLLRHDARFESVLCSTGQHRTLLADVMRVFALTPDYDLDIMQPGQQLADLTAQILLGLKPVFERTNPNCVIVHGDTTTAAAAALGAFYAKVPVVHIEAGLRTGEKSNPFPEELNRRLIGQIADLHLAPTDANRANLLREGISELAIRVTGNTVVDALAQVLSGRSDRETRTTVLVTAHRRENFGAGIAEICEAIKLLAHRNPAVRFVFPVHPNPQIQEPVEAILRGTRNVQLLPPLPYDQFVTLLSCCRLVLTDSGGIQEEASVLGVPVLVMRENTERTEAVKAGYVRVVGVCAERIATEASALLRNERQPKTLSCPYLPGASARIVNALAEQFSERQLQAAC